MFGSVISSRIGFLVYKVDKDELIFKLAGGQEVTVICFDGFNNPRSVWGWLMIEKKKRAIPWKSGKIISIRLRNGVYVLAQMVREPYLVFFNHFKEENSWKGVTLKEENILFL